MSLMVVGKGGTLGRALAERLGADAVETRMPDAADAAPMSELAGRPVVVNASGPRVRPGLTWADYFREHVGVSGRIARSMDPGSHLVHVSSTAVFGARGTRLGAADPEAPTLFPSAAYACAKLAAETQVRAIAHERGVRLTVLRPSMVYGPNVDSALASILKLSRRRVSLRLLPARARQHLVHVDLLVDAVRSAAERPAPERTRVLLVADPFVLTNEDLVPPRGMPISIPLGVAGAANRALQTVDVGGSLTVEALAVLGIDNEFESEPMFDALGLDQARYARSRTFDPYFHGAAGGGES